MEIQGQLQIKFEKSDHPIWIRWSDLYDVLACFIDRLGNVPFVTDEFIRLMGTDENVANRVQRLLKACGFENDPSGFFSAVFSQLEPAGGPRQVVVNHVPIPMALVVALLEKVLPGDGFVQVRDVAQLERLTNIHVPESERHAMQQVMDTYPVRLSMHVIRQMRVSQHVAYQYMPFVGELDPVGHVNTWIGQFHQGIVEQMYRNRVIFLLNMQCPVYCRFCFRKHRENRNMSRPTKTDIRNAVDYVRNRPSIKEILITGGDPFLHADNLTFAMEGLEEISHVQTVRLATRAIAYYPELFQRNGEKLISWLIGYQQKLWQLDKRLEVATHFIHPDEISPQSLEIISRLTGSGIAVYVQVPFLKNCNDQGPELVQLCQTLRGAGAELHYIFIPCSPIHGNRMYWTPISQGIAAGRYLRAHLSDRAVPKICTATPIGKIEWHTSGWAVEPVADTPGFIWLRTPYHLEYFQNFASINPKLSTIRMNEQQTLDIQYMAEIGDPTLFSGPRELSPVTSQPVSITMDEIRTVAGNFESLPGSIVPTGLDALSRSHETRVDVDETCGAAQIDYIGKDSRITDVVIFCKQDLMECLEPIRDIVHRLRAIPHVQAVRLRSLDVNYQPEVYTPQVLDQLAQLNQLRVVQPLRLEIETQFIVAGEFRPIHTDLVRQLHCRGITVYNQTPLLAGINDTGVAMEQLAWHCRKAGIEFHHLYIAGLAIQNHWNAHRPIHVDQVVEIASHVRREGSGREIPNYIIHTCLGDVDFGLSSEVVMAGDDHIRIRLRQCDWSYFTRMDPRFQWPDSVVTDTDGHPLVPITGLVSG